VTFRSTALALFASVEFAVTILISAILYLGAAIYFSIRIYLATLGGALKRSIALWHARIETAPEKSGSLRADLASGVSAAKLKCAGGSSPTSDREQVGRSRFESWLN
jgi:hypothetical protein